MGGSLPSENCVFSVGTPPVITDLPRLFYDPVARDQVSHGIPSNCTTNGLEPLRVIHMTGHHLV